MGLILYKTSCINSVTGPYDSGTIPSLTRFLKKLNTFSKTAASIQSLITIFHMTAHLYSIPVSPRSVFTVWIFINSLIFHYGEFFIHRFTEINCMHRLPTRTSYTHLSTEIDKLSISISITQISTTTSIIVLIFHSSIHTIHTTTTHHLKSHTKSRVLSTIGWLK